VVAAGAARARQCLTVNAPACINYLESISGLAAPQVLLPHFRGGRVRCADLLKVRQHESKPNRPIRF
jgi:hypothetical protein